MSKLIAISFSDLHLHKFTKFSDPKSKINSRLQKSLDVFRGVVGIAYKKKVPVLFSGDLFHNPKELENQVGSLAIQHFYRYCEKRGVDFYAISGNHDLCERNGLNSISPSHLEKFTHFRHFHLLDEFGYIEKDGVWYQGVPYMDDDGDTLEMIKSRADRIKNKKGFKILLLHQDLPGAKTPAGFEAKEYNKLNTNLRRLFKPWNLVLCGHIHKPQIILGGKVYMVGSPIHQIASDEGTKMGYWEVYDDGLLIFKALNDKYPCFISLKKGQVAYNDKDYFIEQPRANLATKEVKSNDFHISKSKKKLAESYITHKRIKSKSKKKALIKILTKHG